jgi:nucleoside-diphosphate-sugar epimerase
MNRNKCTEAIVVGGGLIAQAFAKIKFFNQTLVLASGVSNSSETRETEYKRGAELIVYEISRHPHAHVIYFSTCSLVNGVNSRYMEHKLEMERLISHTSKSFHIFRLPQVVGVVSNMTLVSFLTDAIIREKSLTIQKAAKRHLIDVVDVARIAALLANSNAGVNSVQSITSAACSPVIDIALEIADLLKCGDDQTVGLDFLRKYLPPADIIFENDYWRLVLRKYVPLIVASRK